jgi:hypothetical protein
MSKKDVFWSGDGVRNEIKWKDDEAIVSRYQPVGHIIDSVHELGKLTQNKQAHMKFAGRVPVEVHNEWVNEGKAKGLEGDHLHAFLINKLNNPDFKKLRVNNRKL